MKIVYLIAGTYRPAGMERVLAQKANWLCAHGYEILIVTTDQRGQAPAFELDPGIRTIDLGINYEENNGGSFLSKISKYPGKKRRHKAALTSLLMKEKADIVVSMFCNDASFVPSIKDGSKKVLEIHFSRYKRMQYGRKGLWALTDRLRMIEDAVTVRRFDKFVVLTKEDSLYWGKVKNMVVIPNARPFKFEQPSSLDGKQVLAVGRYDYQKGFDMLLSAWKMIDTEGWTLRIAGAGGDLGPVPGNVVLGPSSDIRSEYMKSSIFALSSRYEGLPMVLLEAQAAGLPVVAFECKCGPKDIIIDGADGYLIPEKEVRMFANRLHILMQDTESRKQMGQHAFRNSDNFDSERIMLEWQLLFEKLCLKKR